MTAIRTARAIAAVVLIGGCASLPEPSAMPAGDVLHVELAENAQGTITAEIRDQTGTVTGARKVQKVWPGSPPRRAIHANPEASSVLVHWMGGECEFHPLLNVSADVTPFTVTLQPDPEPTFSGYCADVAIPYDIELSLSQPIQQDAVRLKMAE